MTPILRGTLELDPDRGCVLLSGEPVVWPTGTPRWSSVALVALLVSLAALLTGCGSAAESACGESVLTDWSDGRIDGVYALHCYSEAIDRLPEDVRVYSSAAEDISRAQQAQLHAEATDEDAAGADNARLLSAREAPTFDVGAEAADALPSGDSASQKPPLPLLLLAASSFALVVAASSTWAVRRLRRRS